MKHSNTPAHSGHSTPLPRRIHFSPLPGDPVYNRQFSIPIAGDAAGGQSLTIITTNNTLNILVYEAIQMGKYNFKVALEAMAKISGIGSDTINTSDAGEDLFWQVNEQAIDLIYPDRLTDEPLLNQALFTGMEEVQLWAR